MLGEFNTIFATNRYKIQFSYYQNLNLQINAQKSFLTLNGEIQLLQLRLLIPQLSRKIWMISDNNWSLKWKLKTSGFSFHYAMKRIGCACTCSMDVLRCFTGTTYFSEVLTNQKVHNKCICHKFSWLKTVCGPAQREEAMSGLWIQNINKLSNLNNWKQSIDQSLQLWYMSA